MRLYSANIPSWSIYRPYFYYKQLGLICLFWMLSCVISWLYLCQIQHDCPLTRLFVTYFAGVFFWAAVTPFVWGKIRILKQTFSAPAGKMAAVIMFCMAIIAINQFVIDRTVAISYQIFYDYHESTVSWISNIISNNILINLCFCGFLVASAWFNPNWNVAGTTEAMSAMEPDLAHRHGLDQQFHSRIQIKEGSVLHNIQAASIRVIQADQNCIHIFTDSRKFTIYSSLVRFSRLLDPEMFIRTHRSTIVNYTRVKRVNNFPSGDAELLLDDGTVIKCSRNYKKQLPFSSCLAR